MKTRSAHSVAGGLVLLALTVACVHAAVIGIDFGSEFIKVSAPPASLLFKCCGDVSHAHPLHLLRWRL
jgi:hypothetical protein